MLNSLQACRALAALIILIFHAEHGIFRVSKYFGREALGPVFDFAPACLDYFFVLSGFIVMYAHLQDIGQPRALGYYLWRRLSRIYLFYWVIFAAVAPVFLLVPSFGFDFQRDPDVIVRSFFLFPHPQFHMILGVAWTMVYDVFFYLVFTSLILSPRFGTLLFVGWMIGCLVHPYLGTSHGSFVFSGIHLRFGAGMLVCLIVQRCRVPAPRLIAFLGGGLFLSTGLVWSYCGMLEHWHHTISFVLSCCLLIAGLSEAERSGLIATPRILTYLGNAAFSIYLVHFPVLSAIAKLGQVLGLARYAPVGVLFASYCLVTLGVCLACYHLIEHPIHIWTKRFFSRPKLSVHADITVTDAIVRKAA